MIGNCRKLFSRQNVIERTKWSTKIKSGVVITDPHWNENSARYSFSARHYEDGKSTWAFNVYVTWNLDVRVEATSDAPQDVIDCVYSAAL